MSLLDAKISMRSIVFSILAVGALALVASRSRAVTPGILSYQGRVLVNGVPHNGAGLFKFALVNAAGTTSFWSNDNTSLAGSEPGAAVSLTVAGGLYSVQLGDTTITGMTTAIPASAFDNADVRLRVWFNDGTNGSKLLSPDQRIVPVGYALVAKGVDDGAVTTGKIADGAVTQAKLAAGVLPSTLPPNGAASGDLTGTYPGPTIGANAVTNTKIADGSVSSAKIVSLDYAKLTNVPVFKAPKVTTIPSGAGLYTTQPGALYLKITMVGGGGGGAGSGTSQSSGTNGNISTFGTLTAGGGGAGTAVTSGTGGGGTGGTILNLTGGYGGGGIVTISGTQALGGVGGNTPFFCGGGVSNPDAAGRAGIANTGGGGSGGSANSAGSASGAGGGSGGYLQSIIIPTTNQSFSYSVGTGGFGGVAGGAGFVGGAGGTGIIIVEEYYQ